jgi:hypothetical protein
VPASVIGGARARASVVVMVSNPDTKAFSGPVIVTLYVSQSQSLTGATEVEKVLKLLKLKAGQSKALRVKVSSFPSVPNGTYYLLTAVQAPDGSTTGVAGPTLAIAAPVVRVQASGLEALTASAAPGKEVALQITLADTGNEPASGTLRMTVSASPSGSATGGQTVASVPLRLSLKAGQKRPYRVKFALPKDLSPGAYTFSGSLDVSALGDDNPADGEATAASILTVT